MQLAQSTRLRIFLRASSGNEIRTPEELLEGLSTPALFTDSFFQDVRRKRLEV